MRFCKIIPVILIFGSIIFAQSETIHEKDFLTYFKIRNKFQASSYENVLIRPLVQKEKNLTHSIFGFLPDWEFVQSPLLRYDLLTHVGIFPFETDSLGNVSIPMNWPWTNFINEAHEEGIKILMTIVNFNPDHIRSIITNEEIKFNLINNILSIITVFNLDGIIVDFEGLYDEDEGEPIVNFIEDLSISINSINENLEVAIATPAINWNNDWNFSALAQYCDFLFVMEYDYYGSWSEVTGPVAPLEGNLWNINITTSLLDDYQEVLFSEPQKLIMGFPYYGAHFISDGNYPGASVIQFVDNPRYEEIIDISGAEYLWSDEFRNSWLRWNDIDWNQIWFDDSLSLSLKYDFAIENDVRGIGIWALGYEGVYPELWDLIEDEFFDNANGNLDEDLVQTEFKLMQNYPNPFNPRTKIKFSIPNLETEYNVSLRIYDILGREINTMFDKKMKTGSYEVEFHAEDLTSGIYFYRIDIYSDGLTFGKISETKKMVLLK